MSEREREKEFSYVERISEVTMAFDTRRQRSNGLAEVAHVLYIEL